MQTPWLDWQVWRRRLVGAILIVGLLLLAYGAYCGWQTYRHFGQLRAHLLGLRSLSLSDADSLGDTLAQLQGDVAYLRRDLGLPLGAAARLGWLPLLGPTLEAAPQLFSAGEMLLGATAAAWEAVGEPVGASLAGDVAVEEAVATLSAEVVARRVQLQGAADQVRQACDLIEAIDADRLVPQMAGPMAQLQPLAPLLTTAFDVLALLPGLVSNPDQGTYLVLAQNNDELRPTGGFISSIGTLSVAQGIPHFGPFADSYRVEDWTKPHPDPPEPLREQMGLDLWVTRDANWWPDFPTSARAVAELYELNQGQQVGGVLALDMAAATRLLEVLTPLQLPSGERLSRGQVAEAFRRIWSLPPGSLVNSGLVMTATRPFSAIELRLSHDGGGTAWFDTVVLEDLRKPGSNLVCNPSFEEDADDDRMPDHWEGVGLCAEDHLVTDQARSGQRSMMILGEPGKTKALVQRIPCSGEEGSSFRLSAESLADSIDSEGGLYGLSATFLPRMDGDEPVVARFPQFTHDWATAGTARVMNSWWRHRKDFMNHVLQAAVGKVLSDSAEVPWLDLIAEVGALLDESHIQVYLVDPELQSIFRRAGWAGEMAEAPGDYLLVVDANVGYNKVSGNIEQLIDYRVEIEASGRVQATLSIRYHNRCIAAPRECNKWAQYLPTYGALAQGCYWDYVRVYVPAGAELRSAKGGDESMAVSSELGRTVFATSLLLRPGEHRELLLEYLLPSNVVRDGAYSLVVQKQAGTDSIPIRIGVGLPRVRGVSYEGLEPDELTRDGPVYRTNLLVDRHLLARLP